MAEEKMSAYHKDRKERINVHRKLFGKDDVKAINNSISKHAKSLSIKSKALRA